jgi:hypothetical protein
MQGLLGMGRSGLTCLIASIPFHSRVGAGEGRGRGAHHVLREIINRQPVVSSGDNRSSSKHSVSTARCRRQRPSRNICLLIRDPVNIQH